MSAALTVATLLTGACTGGKHRANPASTTSTTSKYTAVVDREVTIHIPAFVASRSAKTRGITDTVVVRMRAASGGEPSVSFAQHDVEGTGPQWAAAGWNAVLVATLTTGAPIAGRAIQFDVTGPIDGSSAGALMTVAVIALLRGDQLAAGTTMTGAINPDGSIAPAGNIIEKVDAAAAVHTERMLIPVGEGDAKTASGKAVDVIARAQGKRLRVAETPDVFDAYRAFTGKALPRLPAPETTRLDATAYGKIRPRVDVWLARYHGRAPERADARALGATGSRAVRACRESRRARGERAVRRRSAGGRAVEGAQRGVVDGATAQVGQSFPTLLSAGVKPFVTQVQANAAAAGVASSSKR